MKSQTPKALTTKNAKITKEERL